jgi:hypothetical protein
VNRAATGDSAAQRGADLLLHRGTSHALAVPRPFARVLQLESQPPEPRNHAALRIVLHRRPRLRLRPRLPRRLALARHEPRPEDALRLVLVVGLAAQANVLLARDHTPARDRIDVVKLEVAGRPAAVAVLAHERALATVAHPHLALHWRRDVPRIHRRALLARPRGGGELLLLGLLDQPIEPQLDQFRHVPGGNLVAEQGPGVLELVLRALPDAELPPVALGRERRHLGTRLGRRKRGTLQGLNTPRGVLASGLRGQLGLQARGRTWREGLHPGGQVRLGEALREQALDLGSGLVRGSRQQLADVLRRQVRGQGHHAAQMQPALGHGVEDRGIPPGRAGGVDAPERGLLGQVQHVDAVEEHRRIAGGHVELAGIDLGDAGEEVGGGGAFARGHVSQSAQQVLVAGTAKRAGLHGPESPGGGCLGGRDRRALSLYHELFRRSGRAAGLIGRGGTVFLPWRERKPRWRAHAHAGALPGRPHRAIRAPAVGPCQVNFFANGPNGPCERSQTEPSLDYSRGVAAKSHRTSVRM